MQQAILVFFARFLDFKDDEGKPVKGTQVHYQIQGVDSPEGAVGLQVAESFIKDQNLMELIPCVGVYVGNFVLSVRGGKPELKLSGVGQLMHRVELVEVKPSEKAGAAR